MRSLKFLTVVLLIALVSLGVSASAFGTDKTHWMKDVSPVNITYKVNGVTYVVQHCQSEPGFHCE